mmetsp:Transcript_20906/g.39084  ORF Transcript_20906/g.39084 Transcript_20906/m.39084 type:complete len:237 (+) Transcript_20906:2-712(+)
MNWQSRTATQLEKRRRMLLRPLFLHVADRNLLQYDMLQEYMEKKITAKGGIAKHPIKYAAIHSRWLEGSCERRVGDKLPKDECWMSPEYIKEILGDTIDHPIVLIGDGQNEEVLRRLRSDKVIGPHLIVPEELPRIRAIDNREQPVSDMVVGINADIFIGTRVSTMALMVGMIRVILGADPVSNYIYVHRDKKPLISLPEGDIPRSPTQTLSVCKECLFLCNISKSDICGHESLYA